MRKAKIVSCLLLAASALLPLAGHAQDRGRGDERGGPPWAGATGTGIAVGTATTATRAVARSTSTAAPIATVRAAGPRATGFPGIPPAPIYRRRLARLPPGPAAARLPLGRRRRRLFPGRPDRYRLQRDDRRLTRACRNKNPRSRLAIAGFLLPGRRSGRGRRTVQRVPHDPSARLERMQAQAQDARRNPRQVMAQLTGAPGLIAQLPDDVQRPGPAQESERLGDLARRRRRGSVLA